MKQVFPLILPILFFLPSVLRAQKTDALLPSDTPSGVEEKADAFYLEALRQQMKGSHTEAFALFRHALALNPRLVGALYEMSNYGHHLRNDSMALRMMERAAAIDTGNFWLKQALVELYVGQKRDGDAIAQLEQMSKQYPQKSDVLLMLVDMYTRKQDFASVVKTLDRVELLEGKSEQLSMEKFRAYAQMKDEKRAFAEMKALAEEYPNDVRYRVLIGDLYLDNGRLDDAYGVYRQIERDSPDNINLQLSLANYYQQTGNDSLYMDAMERLVANEQIDDDTRVRFMQSFAYTNIQQRDDTTKVLPLFRRVLALPQKDTRMAELCARYMVARELPPAAIKPVLLQMLRIDPEADLARNQLLTYSIQENDTAEMIRLCKTAVDYNTSDPVYYYYLGIGYFQQRRNREALDTFQKGLAKVDDKSNLSLLTNIYAISGDLYHMLGDDKRAFESYDSCLLYRPDDALVLNNYAYYLSLQKRDLDRAAEMSQRSIRKEGDNPTYLDTYAWILFQQKRYAEARAVIDTVMALLGDPVAPDDATLVEHAGDIYAKCGDTARAVQLWQQAKSLGVDSATIDEKLRRKRYVAPKQ